MADNRSYLGTASLLLATTAMLLAGALIATAWVLTSATPGTAYRVCVAFGLGCLLASLILGGLDLVRNVALLGCDAWNVRGVAGPLRLRVILLCLGALFAALSLFLI